MRNGTFSRKFFVQKKSVFFLVWVSGFYFASERILLPKNWFRNKISGIKRSFYIGGFTQHISHVFILIPAEFETDPQTYPIKLKQKRSNPRRRN